MARADSNLTTRLPIDPSRRRFMAFTAAASAFAAGSLAVAATPTRAHQACTLASLGDADLLNLKEQIFEAHEAATANVDEIYSLHAIFRAEAVRLREEVEAGRMNLTRQEQWDLAGSIPDARELERLEALAEPHYDRANDLVEQMWKIPTTTRRGAKLSSSCLSTTSLGTTGNAAMGGRLGHQARPVR